MSSDHRTPRSPAGDQPPVPSRPPHLHDLGPDAPKPGKPSNRTLLGLKRPQQVRGEGRRPPKPPSVRAANLAARRMLVTAAVITIVILAGFSVFRLLDGPSEPVAVPTTDEWTGMVVFQPTTGAGIKFTAAAQPIGEYASVGTVDKYYTEGSTMALVTPDKVIVGPLPKNGSAPNNGSSNDGSVPATIPPIATVPPSTSTPPGGSPSGSTPATTPATTTPPTTRPPDVDPSAKPTVVSSPTGSYQLSIPEGFIVWRLRVPHRLLIGIGHPTGGNVVIADLLNRRTIDLGELTGQPDPRLSVDSLIYDDAGTLFAIYDKATAQTIIFTMSATVPIYVSNVPIAVGDNIVATAQTTGERDDVFLFDGKGTQLTHAPTEKLWRSYFDGTTLVAATTAERLIKLAPKDNEFREFAQGVLPAGNRITELYPLKGGERILVTGNKYQALLDRNGNKLYYGTFPVDVQPTRPNPEWVCLPIGGDPVYSTVISVQTGAELANLTNMQLLSMSADGCDLAMEAGDGTVVLHLYPKGDIPAIVTSIGRTIGVWVSPDGRTVVRQPTPASAQVLAVDDQGTATVVGDLSPWTPPEFDVNFVP